MKREKQIRVGTFFPWNFFLAIFLGALKMDGQLDVSWWVVTSPFWLPLGYILTLTVILPLLLVTVAGIITLVAGLIDAFFKGR